jgi:hypothetical protein
MSTFAALGVELHLLTSLALLPVAAIGHVVGLKMHDMLMRNDVMFKRVIGAMLSVVSALALWKLYQ